MICKTHAQVVYITVKLEIFQTTIAATRKALVPNLIQALRLRQDNYLSTPVIFIYHSLGVIYHENDHENEALLHRGFVD